MKSECIKTMMNKLVHKKIYRLLTIVLWIMLIKILSIDGNLTNSRFRSYPQNLCIKSMKLWTSIE